MWRKILEKEWYSYSQSHSSRVHERERRRFSTMSYLARRQRVSHGGVLLVFYTTQIMPWETPFSEPQLLLHHSRPCRWILDWERRRRGIRKDWVQKSSIYTL
jgi:hypothetical protein